MRRITTISVPESLWQDSSAKAARLGCSISRVWSAAMADALYGLPTRTLPAEITVYGPPLLLDSTACTTTNSCVIDVLRELGID